ncbi:PfkB family carbohydrate kinase [Microbacterium sp. 179-B 1A2 NHS]|uniref:PfkB family carbohydrate kinase n=1 Tax=Microbacterium sp. 179-B 1A2 NHS TaxID=3142383 RepID=UPI0039A12160
MSSDEKVPAPPHPDLDAARRRVTVVGAAARDLVVQAALPGAGASAPVTRVIERLGGKGANIAAGVLQLIPGAAVSLIAVLGADAAGDAAATDATDLGLDIAAVARRGETSLLVDVTDGRGERRLLEHVPAAAIVTASDVRAAASVLRAAGVVVLQLQQDAEALVEAADIAHDAGAVLVLDGATGGAARDRLLPRATVVRADAAEAEMLTGRTVSSRADAERAAADLLERGPRLVALAVPGEGDLVVWPEGSHLFAHRESAIVDPTGAGDAFIAGLVAGLLADEDPFSVGQRGADAAATAVQQLGGFTRFG